MTISFLFIGILLIIFSIYCFKTAKNNSSPVYREEKIIEGIVSVIVGLGCVIGAFIN